MPQINRAMANGKRRTTPAKKLASLLKNLGIYALIGLAALIFFVNISGGVNKEAETPISQIINDIKDGKVAKLELQNDYITANYKDKYTVSTRKEAGESIYRILESAGVDPKSVSIEIKDISWQQNWLSLLGTILPIILLIGFFFLMFRQAREAGQGIFSFGQSRAKIFTKDQPQIKFADVAGAQESKKELSEVVEFLKTPEKFTALGARTPKGVLLVGPAGVGKTLMARAVAGEAGVAFFSIAGSEFMEILVGVGAARVRDMFAQAKKAAPSIIFIDEIESIGRQRGMGGMGGGHDEREQTLNQILVEMDGFNPNETVIVIGASVTGDTPILVKYQGQVKLIPIREFVDQFYMMNEAGQEKLINGYQALGFEKKNYSHNLQANNLYFDRSAFKNIRGVFRHKVSEIYEIDYLGGKIRATGNHSVFIRTRQGIRAQPVVDLKVGDTLVDLPVKVNRTNKWQREVRGHVFEDQFHMTLPVNPLITAQRLLTEQYQLVINNPSTLSQQVLASQVGVTQTTVSNWQAQKSLPRTLSTKYFQHQISDSVEVTPELCRLLGYYTAEGYARKGLDFCLHRDEVVLQQDIKDLMQAIFGLNPDKERFITNNAINIVYNASQITDFFIQHCGKGSHAKHIPNFLFEAPREYFLEYLKACILGDGYVTKEGKIEITSVSQQLILELNWICRMHGIKSSIREWTVKAGRTIGSGKPLAATQAFRLLIGARSNPFRSDYNPHNNYTALPRIKSIRKLPYNDYVYDLCGMDNEAFFGGYSPILLHNTNRPDLLDQALVRPGRFDRRVTLGYPDLEERKEIIGIHMKNKPFEKNVNMERIARRTVGFTGADLANMLNEAAILAAREGKKAIDHIDLEEAATKVKLGPQRKRMQSDHDRKLAAYHEAGHAVVGHFLKNIDPVHRITIVARGQSGGHTMFPPTEDRSNESKSRLMDQITTALGGQAAEKMILNDISTGASSDIEIANAIARAMVTDYGMSELGPISAGQKTTYGWGRGDGETIVSEQWQNKIDHAVKKILDESYRQATALLKKNRSKLDKVAKALLDKETLDGDDFEKIVGKKKVS